MSMGQTLAKSRVRDFADEARAELLNTRYMEEYVTYLR